MELRLPEPSSSFSGEVWEAENGNGVTELWELQKPKSPACSRQETLSRPLPLPSLPPPRLPGPSDSPRDSGRR